MAKYRISVEKAISHGWKYSPFFDQLVFIFSDADGNITCTQARNFRQGAKTKYFNQGSAAGVLPIFSGLPRSGTSHRRIVVVEDAVSAARIAPQCDSMPCLGSYLPVQKITALKLLNYEFIDVWLDEDKLRESREIAEKSKWLGLSSRVIYTELDPKEYSDEEIKKWNDRADSLYKRELELAATPNHQESDLQDLRASRNESIQRANYPTYAKVR